MDIIFNLIKKKNFSKLKEIIKSTKEDLNNHDEHYNYLIHYIINLDLVDILEITLKNHNIRLDILDYDKRTILFVPIKYNYINCLELLLKYNKKNIGISILDIQDTNGLTALHYCILFNNIIGLKLLLENDADVYIKDNKGYNILQYCLLYNREEIFKYLLTIDINFDFYDNNNNTLLQLAIDQKRINLIDIIIKNTKNINNQNLTNNVTALHQSINLKDINIIKLLLNNEADLNIQDVYGNTPLFYVIYDELFTLIQLFISYPNIKYNITNLNGCTPLHILLYNYEKIKNNIKIDKFIEETNLNIQDNNGNTCLHLLIYNKILDKYNLCNKELNIFIKNANNISCFDLIKKNNGYINIIIESYYNLLKLNNNNLIIEWEKSCGKSNKVIECKKRIKNTIFNEHRSLPQEKEIKLILDSGIFVKVCFYVGVSLDIISGLIFLKNKFEKKGLNLILDYPLTINDNLKKIENFYLYENDFHNYEIFWFYQQIIYPTYFDEELSKEIKHSKYIVISIGIMTLEIQHANILFYDVKNQTVERFEPHGDSGKFLNYNNEKLDNILELKFKSFNSKIKYIRPKDYLPVMGLQRLEYNTSKLCLRIGDPNGFCGVWCIWWIYHKMLNLHIDSKTLVNKLINEIKLNNMSFKNLIRDFSKNITDIRDKLLSKYNLDINDFMNYKISIDIINKLDKDIYKMIK